MSPHVIDTCAASGSPNLWDALSDVLRRLRDWSQETRDARLEEKRRARFWSDVRAGEREAEGAREDADAS